MAALTFGGVFLVGWLACGVLVAPGQLDDGVGWALAVALVRAGSSAGRDRFGAPPNHDP
jgi:hypothetical protein